MADPVLVLGAFLLSEETALNMKISSRLGRAEHSVALGLYPSSCKAGFARPHRTLQSVAGCEKLPWGLGSGGPGRGLRCCQVLPRPLVRAPHSAALD